MGNKHYLALIHRILLSAFLFIAIACENHNPAIYEGYGMLKHEGNSDLSIILDDGNVIKPIEGQTCLGNLSDSSRIQSTFTVLEEHASFSEVSLVQIDTILTKSVLPYSQDIIEYAGNAPVMITNAWIAHGFLNLEFAFVGDNKRHMVNLLQKTVTTDKLEFEFRHNDFNDQREKTMMGVVSFRLHSILEPIEKPTKVVVQYNDSDNSARSITLVYNNK